MHPLAKEHFKKILEKYEPLEINKSCVAYPCHPNLEDCTFCYCPFYPCEDDFLGKYVKAAMWSCESCDWIHRRDITNEIIEEMKNLCIHEPEDIEKVWYDLKNNIKDKVKAKYPP
ncbi:MAG: cysteine-rich small domain-containing protein [Candidatus Aenigmarchaeota archaeon]|nr:cysteine-rich small domain-containing protein [Candidatus Aenigmarchaeota archaeon]